MRNPLFIKSRGSVESFITLIPQVFIFLFMFQLIFMQFSFIKDTHTFQGRVSKAALLGSSEYMRYPLVGGGSVILESKRSSIDKFIDFNSIARKQVTAIAVDEYFGS